MMTLSTPIAALWLALSAAQGAPIEPVFYTLTPFAESAPALQAAWDARERPGKAHAALRESLEAPGAATPPGADPLIKRTGHWLVADGLIRQGALDAATPHAQELDVQGSSLIDPLIPKMTEAFTQAKRPDEAAQWAFAHVHAGSAMRDSCADGVAEYRRLKRTGIGLQRIKELLTRTLSVRTRRALSLLAAELELDTDKKGDAKRRLRRLWWETSSKDMRLKAAGLLKRLGAAPSTLEELAELAFETRRKDAKSVRRRLKRTLRKTRRRETKRLIIWARALIAGLESDKREESESVVAIYTRRLRGTPAEPWTLVGHALALRRLNRDVEAAQVYEDMATRFPDHPLTGHALVEGAGLYLAKGYPTEADALYRRTLTLTQHGDPEKEALWQVGFRAVLRGQDAEAVPLFQRLIVGYGGQRDGLGTTWTERAQYWWARAESRLGHHDDAKRLYDTLIGRFPSGWYATLASARLAELGGAPSVLSGSGAEGSLRVVRQPTLDYPVALMRLGAVDAAVDVLKSLSMCGQLPGTGRVLLAALYRRQGHDKKADSLLRRHGVLAEVPTVANAKTYVDAFPYKYGDTLERYAAEAGISPAWLAGLTYVESRFNPKARSGVGAIGLTQLMPGTARRISKRLLGKPVSTRALRRVKTNLRLGATLLRRLMNRFKDHSVIALAAYNAGSGAATSWLRKRGHLPTDAWVETIPFDQARRYVMRVSSMTRVYHELYRVPGPIPPIHPQLPTALGSFDGPEGEGASNGQTPTEAKP
ncbi:MAG: transglycosylase SLT domain-containing protein [Myxococcota bacterium]